MKLSIIIPTYNRCILLKNILNNLITQNENNFEVLVIDDNSFDSTKKEVKSLENKYNFIKYYKNNWKWQRDWKKTWLNKSNWDYILFLEDDIEIKDKNFIKKIYKNISKDKVIVSKIIMLDKWKTNILEEPKKFSKKPLTIIELSKWMINEWTKKREIFPFMETWVIFHKNLSNLFIDKNLILDCYGESFASWIKLIKKWIKIEFTPELEIYHLWSNEWWSKKFNKKPMLKDFSLFHYGYFYNMIYLHSKYKPFFVFIWLPFYLSKTIIALINNKNIKWFYKYALKPILISFYYNFLLRRYKK